MPEPLNIGSITNSNTLGAKQYLPSNEKAVNVHQALASQETKAAGGLDGIKIRQKAQQLGKDDFLKLLVTQLSYQDPTAPVKDQQFIAQMAQFSSLEQMQNMASSLGRLADRQAHGLIGRYVVGRDFVSGSEIAGIARALFYDEAGKPFLKIGGRAVALDDLQMIGDAHSVQKKYGGLGASSVQKKVLQKKMNENEIISTQKIENTTNTNANKNQENKNTITPNVNEK